MNKILVSFRYSFLPLRYYRHRQCFAIGAALAIAVMVGGPISGGNFNPVVTIMMAVAGKQPMKEVVPYILAQVAGGLAAFELSKRIKL